MKKLTILLLLIAVVHYGFSQQPVTNAPAIEKDYLKKSKNQKTTAWIMLGGGSALLLAGIIIPRGEMIHDYWLWPEYENDDLRASFGLCGVLAMAGSIPFFIASSKNKKKAAALSFKNETARQFFKDHFAKTNVPSLSLKISL